MVAILYWIVLAIDVMFGSTFLYSALVQTYSNNFDRTMAFTTAFGMLLSGALLIGARQWYV